MGDDKVVEKSMSFFSQNPFKGELMSLLRISFDPERITIDFVFHTDLHYGSEPPDSGTSKPHPPKI